MYTLFLALLMGVADPEFKPSPEAKKVLEKAQKEGKASKNAKIVSEGVYKNRGIVIIEDDEAPPQPERLRIMPRVVGPNR